MEKDAFWMEIFQNWSYLNLLSVFDFLSFFVLVFAFPVLVQFESLNLIWLKSFSARAQKHKIQSQFAWLQNRNTIRAVFLQSMDV